jgi:uncharacterized membrane protein
MGWLILGLVDLIALGVFLLCMYAITVAVVRAFRKTSLEAKATHLEDLEEDYNKVVHLTKRHKHIQRKKDAVDNFMNEE